MRSRSWLPVLLTGALVMSGVGAAPVSAAALAAPAVSGLSATSSRLAGGAHLVVHGSGFIGVRTVLVGRTTAHVLKVTSRQLTIVVPGHKAGRVDVRVITS